MNVKCLLCMEVFSYAHGTLHFLSIIPVVSRCLPGSSLPATCWSLLGAHQKVFTLTWNASTVNVTEDPYPLLWTLFSLPPVTSQLSHPLAEIVMALHTHRRVLEGHFLPWNLLNTVYPLPHGLQSPVLSAMLPSFSQIQPPGHQTFSPGPISFICQVQILYPNFHQLQMSNIIKLSWK